MAFEVHPLCPFPCAHPLEPHQGTLCLGASGTALSLSRPLLSIDYSHQFFLNATFLEGLSWMLPLPHLPRRPSSLTLLLLYQLQFPY